jgi:hypothetical protein
MKMLRFFLSFIPILNISLYKEGEEEIFQMTKMPLMSP